MIKKVLSIIHVIIFIFLVQNFSSAQANELSFRVNPIIPNNQASGVQSYFDLNVEPNSSQKLQFEISNLLDKPTSVLVTPTNGLTNKNGGIQYVKESSTPNAQILDESFLIFDNIAIQNEINLKPKETKTITFTINTPSGDTGTYIGGLLFNKNEVDNVETIKKEGTVSFQLLNKSAFAMGIKLNMPKPGTEQFSFGETKIDFLPTGIELNMEFNNGGATLQIVDEIQYKVLDSNNDIAFKGSLKNVKMAPMNSLKYPVFWEGTSIKAGNYSVELIATINDKTIKDTSSFEVEKKKLKKHIEKADKTTNQIIVKEQTPIWIWITIGFVITVLFLIIIFILIKFKNEKKKKSSNDEKEKF